MSFAERIKKKLREQQTIAGLIEADERGELSKENFESIFKEATEGDPDEAWEILVRLAPTSLIGAMNFVGVLKVNKADKKVLE